MAILHIQAGASAAGAAAAAPKQDAPAGGRLHTPAGTFTHDTQGGAPCRIERPRYSPTSTTTPAGNSTLSSPRTSTTPATSASSPGVTMN